MIAFSAMVFFTPTKVDKNTKTQHTSNMPCFLSNILRQYCASQEVEALCLKNSLMYRDCAVMNREDIGIQIGFESIHIILAS